MEGEAGMVTLLFCDDIVLLLYDVWCYCFGTSNKSSHLTTHIYLQTPSTMTCASGFYRVLDGLRPLNRQGSRARSGSISTDGLSEMVHNAFR